MTTTIDHAVTTRQDSPAMTDTTPPDPEVRDPLVRATALLAKYKTRILAEYDALDRSARGAFLRREGLYSSLIATWRRQRDEGGTTRSHERPGARVQTLEIVRSPGCGGTTTAWPESSTSRGG